jgi:predicted phosphate transport protein (TIGR00153 family)
MNINDIARKLFPRKTQFYDLLEASTHNLSDAAQLLTTLAKQDVKAERNVIIDRIKELELQGDRITHQIYKALSTTFITPIDAEDIHALASALDDIMDRIEGIAMRIRLYDIETLPPSFLEMISILSKQIEHISEIIPQLRELRKASSIIDRCVEIHKLENEADKIYYETIGELFSGQDNLLENLKLKEIIARLEWATDSCERVANLVEHVVLKYS